MQAYKIRLHDITVAERPTWSDSNAKIIEGKSTARPLQLSNKSRWLMNGRLVG